MPSVLSYTFWVVEQKDTVDGEAGYSPSFSLSGGVSGAGGVWVVEVEELVEEVGLQAAMLGLANT